MFVKEAKIKKCCLIFSKLITFQRKYIKPFRLHFDVPTFSVFLTLINVSCMEETSVT